MRYRTMLANRKTGHAGRGVEERHSSVRSNTGGYENGAAPCRASMRREARQASDLSSCTEGRPGEVRWSYSEGR